MAVRLRSAVLLSLLFLDPRPLSAATALAQLIEAIRWGEPATALAARFGAAATILPQPLDFGDSYVPLVIRDVPVGGVPLIAFFQIDKATGVLKRIQLERQRHGVNPPAFRGVLAGLETEFGAPDERCVIPSSAASGYQAALELYWSHRGDSIRAIFRDTTIEAFEGCVDRTLTSGPCGLTGQLLVRISPPGTDPPACVAQHHGAR